MLAYPDTSRQATPRGLPLWNLRTKNKRRKQSRWTFVFMSVLLLNKTLSPKLTFDLWLKMLNNPPEDAPRKPGIFPKTLHRKPIPITGKRALSYITAHSASVYSSKKVFISLALLVLSYTFFLLNQPTLFFFFKEQKQMNESRNHLPFFVFKSICNRTLF